MSEVGDHTLEEPFDDAVLVYSTTSEFITSLQYVVFSGSFQVPAFYFTMHDSSLSTIEGMSV